MNEAIIIGANAFYSIHKQQLEIVACYLCEWYNIIEIKEGEI